MALEGEADVKQFVLGDVRPSADGSGVEVVLGELEMDDPVTGSAVVATDGLHPAAPIDVAEVREPGTHHAEAGTERMRRQPRRASSQQHDYEE